MRFFAPRACIIHEIIVNVVGVWLIKKKTVPYGLENRVTSMIKCKKSEDTPNEKKLGKKTKIKIVVGHKQRSYLFVYYLALLHSSNDTRPHNKLLTDSKAVR